VRFDLVKLISVLGQDNVDSSPAPDDVRPVPGC